MPTTETLLQKLPPQDEVNWKAIHGILRSDQDGQEEAFPLTLAGVLACGYHGLATIAIAASIVWASAAVAAQAFVP